MIALGNYVFTPGLSGDGLGRVGGFCGLLFPFNRAKREACRAKDDEAKEIRLERREERREMKALQRGGGGTPAGTPQWLPLAIGGVVLVGVVWMIMRRRKAATA